jgi:hypothetical protein
MASRQATEGTVIGCDAKLETQDPMGDHKFGRSAIRQDHLVQTIGDR